VTAFTPPDAAPTQAPDNRTPDTGKGPKPVAVIRVSRLWSVVPGSAAAEAAKRAVEPEGPPGLDAFGSESAPGKTPVSSPSTPVPPRKPAANSSKAASIVKWTLAFVVLAAAVGAGAWQYVRRASAPVPGSLTVQTTPAGMEVLIGGAPAGRTPLTVTLPPGSHLVQVGTAGQRRDLEVAMVSGATIQHHLEIAPAAPAAMPAAVGSLRVQTGSPGMAVSVDGVERGRSPLTITGLEPGEHQVVVRGEEQTVRQRVAIKPGETVALVISPSGPSVAAPGWLVVSSPVVMQLLEGGQIIGTTETAKLMLPSGDHDIQFVNDAIGYKTSRRITVAPGKVTSTAVELPTGLLSINALPWAEVWLDGQRIGETPIANVPARPGAHEVMFRHPQLGERREKIFVTLRQPARLGIDLRRQQP
jgi:PEGA domain